MSNFCERAASATVIEELPMIECNLDEVGAIRDQVCRTGYAIQRPNGLVELCDTARSEYLAAFKQTKLQPPKIRFSYGDLARGPWRKLTIGSQNGAGEAYAQFLQSMYFDAQQSRYPSLNRLFKFMNALRNQLMNVSPEFGDNPVRDRFWNACRVHHYPRGGGFMMTHCDTYFPIKLGDLPFYQVMVPLSVKGRDFTQGGGVLFTRDGTRLDTDNIAGFGSVVVFDGRIRHGVEDVDPVELVDFNDTMGRLAAFSNLYVTPAN